MSILNSNNGEDLAYSLLSGTIISIRIDKKLEDRTPLEKKDCSAITGREVHFLSVEGSQFWLISFSTVLLRVPCPPQEAFQGTQWAADREEMQGRINPKHIPLQLSIFPNMPELQFSSLGLQIIKLFYSVSKVLVKVLNKWEDIFYEISV
uniref:Uncharacterized protein n=1 Tax=Sphaerodactylus townsendi TaxID=933632 RepID=A0ACB8G3M4_9SAUR